MLDTLLDEGFGLDVEAYWGAGFLPGRYLAGSPTWEWPELVGRYVGGTTAALLDLGTGEGGVLAGLPGLPALTVATEEWLATVPEAARTLVPRGINLVVCGGARENTSPDAPPRTGLPFADASFDVVLSRHEAFDPSDVRRVLRPGGVFLIQQVGSDETASIRALCQLPGIPGTSWDLAEAVRQTEAGGLTVIGSGEERPKAVFTDVAALVGYLRTIPWSVPELDRDAMRPTFERLHAQDRLGAVSHRFWLAARP